MRNVARPPCETKTNRRRNLVGAPLFFDTTNTRLFARRAAASAHKLPIKTAPPPTIVRRRVCRAPACSAQPDRQEASRIASADRSVNSARPLGWRRRRLFQRQVGRDEPPRVYRPVCRQQDGKLVAGGRINHSRRPPPPTTLKNSKFVISQRAELVPATFGCTRRLQRRRQVAQVVISPRWPLWRALFKSRRRRRSR